MLRGGACNGSGCNVRIRLQLRLLPTAFTAYFGGGGGRRNVPAVRPAKSAGGHRRRAKPPEPNRPSRTAAEGAAGSFRLAHRDCKLVVVANMYMHMLKAASRFDNLPSTTLSQKIHG